MKIINSTTEDIDFLFYLYDAATAHQKTVTTKHWLGFDRGLVAKEIEEGRQWKILIEDQIACVFVLTFSDPEIWQAQNEDPAIYIHRIATNPAFRGQAFVKHIVAWAKPYAASLAKQFVRLDTTSGNDKLNAYYESCGFTYLGIRSVTYSDDMPEHYKNGPFSLFEMKVE